MVDINARYAIGTLIFLLLGPIAWGLHFGVLYGMQSSLCALEIGSSADGHNGLLTTLILATTLALMAVPVLAVWNGRATHGWLAGAPMASDSAAFVIGAARALTALSALAMAYSALAAVLLPACAQMR
tara:strand:- start:10829 stop:11212 length:384 start_codon:yes stop_codon:yes gene_type:complete